MRKRVIQYSVCQSVSQSFCHTTKSGSWKWQSPEDWNKHPNVALDIFKTLWCARIFCLDLIFFKKKLVILGHKIISNYSHAVFMWANNFFAARGSLHYTVFSAVYHSVWSFPLKLLMRWESPVCFMNTPLTFTVSLHELHIDLLKLYISTCMSYILAYSYWYYSK